MIQNKKGETEERIKIEIEIIKRAVSLLSRRRDIKREFQLLLFLNQGESSYAAGQTGPES